MTFVMPQTSTTLCSLTLNILLLVLRPSFPMSTAIFNVGTRKRKSSLIGNDDDVQVEIRQTALERAQNKHLLKPLNLHAAASGLIESKLSWNGLFHYLARVSLGWVEL
jgi:hypothetical protein